MLQGAAKPWPLGGLANLTGIARKAISPARRKAWVRAAARQPEASPSHGVPVIDISTLNPAQLEAVTAPDGPVLVIAGAGSGKTRVLTERLMAYLTDAEHPVDIDHFLVITSTRAAAAELSSRILDGIYARIASDPEIRRLRRQFSFKTAKSAVQSFHCTALFLIHKNEKTNIISARRSRTVR